MTLFGGSYQLRLLEERIPAFPPGDKSRWYTAAMPSKRKKTKSNPKKSAIARKRVNRPKKSVNKKQSSKKTSAKATARKRRITVHSAQQLESSSAREGAFSSRQ